MKDWEDIYKEKGELQKEVLPKIKEIVPFFKKQNVKKVLDLGCGTGRHTIFLAKKGFEIIGTDISETGLSILQNKLKKGGIKNVKLTPHDMKSIPYPDNNFDAVIAIGVLPHGKINDIRKTVDDIHRVLRKGGYLVTDTMSTEDPDYGTGKEIEPNTFIGLEEEEETPHHYYTKEEMLNLFSKFKILKFYHKNVKLNYKTRKDRASQWHLLAQK